MPANTLSAEDLKAIEEVFGVPLKELSAEGFAKLHRELRAKYHPDRFAQYDDEVVKEW